LEDVTTYTIHEALIPPRELDRRADDIIFVKEGFSWWALLAPVPWLLYRRLWLETLAYFVLIAIVVHFGMNSPAIGPMWVEVVMFLLNLLLAFHANDLRRWAMARRGRPLVAVVAGTNYQECERRFFEAWLPFAIRDQARRWNNPAATPALDRPLARPASGEPIIGFPGEGG
jgi:hypothetical protein